MSKLVLYLSGQPFQEQDIEIPEFTWLDSDELTPAQNWENRAQARIDYVDGETLKFKLNFLKAIISQQHKYFIELIIHSKFNDHDYSKEG